MVRIHLTRGSRHESGKESIGYNIKYGAELSSIPKKNLPCKNEDMKPDTISSLKASPGATKGVLYSGVLTHLGQ